MGSTRGTLHPDLLRVVEQDGFGYRLLDPAASGAADEVVAELGAGRPVLILEIREETGGLHWVVGDRWEDGRLRLRDSLAEGPIEVDGAVFLRSRALSLVFLAPKEGRGSEEFWPAHEDGIAEMRWVQERLKKVPSKERKTAN